MDSSLILQFIEASQSGGRSLWPSDPQTLQQAMRVVSLALAACEKSVQTVYERNLRPTEAQYAPWLERIGGQLRAAYAALETECRQRPRLFADRSHASITAAVAWQFTQAELPGVIPSETHPGLAALSQRLEDTPVFRKYPPTGPGVQRPANATP
jgi:glutathione S-transferase